VNWLVGSGELCERWRRDWREGLAGYEGWREVISAIVRYVGNLCVLVRRPSRCILDFEMV
jgi:hypothetical protein